MQAFVCFGDTKQVFLHFLLSFELFVMSQHTDGLSHEY